MKNQNNTQLLDAKKIIEKELGIEAGDVVADFGCGGSGYFTFETSKIVGEKGRVYAVDIMKHMLKGLKNHAKMLGHNNIETVWSDLEYYGGAEIKDESVDFLLLVNVLFQSKSIDKVLREASRVMKKGGKMLIVDWKRGRFYVGPPQDLRIEKNTIEDATLGAGFKKVRDVEVGKCHYGIIFEKI